MRAKDLKVVKLSQSARGRVKKEIKDACPRFRRGADFWAEASGGRRGCDAF